MTDLYVACRPGKDPRVVLVHGSMDSAASFGALENRLDETEVLRYDRRGYGRSATPADAASFSAHVDDLIAVLDSAPAIVVGHSLGGVIALAASVREPRLVHRVLVYEPPMPWLPWWPPLELPSDQETARKAAEAFLRGHMGDRRWEELPADRRADFLQAAPTWAEELRTATHGAPPFRFGQIRVPVTSVYGTASDDRHIRAAHEVAANVSGARLEHIDGGDHQAHRTRPEAFAAIIRQLRNIETERF